MASEGIFQGGSRKFIILLLYVDDILIVGNCTDKIDQVKRKLSEEFEMKDLGHPETFLEIEIKRDRREKVLYLHQRKFIEKMLIKFGMSDCKPVSTPIITREGEMKGSKIENKNKNIEIKNYTHIGKP